VLYVILSSVLFNQISGVLSKHTTVHAQLVRTFLNGDVGIAHILDFHSSLLVCLRIGPRDHSEAVTFQVFLLRKAGRVTRKCQHCNEKFLHVVFENI